MQSYHKALPGYRIYQWLPAVEGEGGYSVINGTSRIEDFLVTNGLVQGNKRSPNPTHFRKVVTQSQSWHRFRRFSGYPQRGWDLITSDMDGAPWQYDINTALREGKIAERWPGLNDQILKSVFDQMRYGSGNLVVDLAESAQTIKMIKNATSVRKIVTEFGRSMVIPRNLGGSRRLKYVSDKWLEYRYGWLPFVSSTYELLKTLSTRVNKATIVAIEAKAGYKDKWPEVLGTNDTLVFDQSARAFIKVRMRARDTLEIYDFTSLNPLNIAWELAPLSFVADWFVNVGETLSLWEDYILFANRFVDGFRTYTVKEDAFRSFAQASFTNPPTWPNGHDVDGYTYQYIETKSASRLYRAKTREILLSLPAPGGLRVDVRLNSKRLLDAAALIRGAFGNPRLK